MKLDNRSIRFSLHPNHTPSLNLVNGCLYKLAPKPTLKIGSHLPPIGMVEPGILVAAAPR
jgi:hypothetical protein